MWLLLLGLSFFTAKASINNQEASTLIKCELSVYRTVVLPCGSSEVTTYPRHCGCYRNGPVNQASLVYTPFQRNWKGLVTDSIHQNSRGTETPRTSWRGLPQCLRCCHQTQSAYGKLWEIAGDFDPNPYYRMTGHIEEKRGIPAKSPQVTCGRKACLELWDPDQTIR